MYAYAKVRGPQKYEYGQKKHKNLKAYLLSQLHKKGIKRSMAKKTRQ